MYLYMYEFMYVCMNVCMYISVEGKLPIELLDKNLNLDTNRFNFFL